MTQAKRQGGKINEYKLLINGNWEQGAEVREIKSPYHGKIVKEGNRWLRWAAVEAVYPGIKADFDIKSFYHRQKKRKGSNTAKVATARRMLTIIYQMLKENRLYIPYKR